MTDGQQTASDAARAEHGAADATATQTYVQQLGAFAAACRDDGVPDEVAQSVRRRIVDTLGICVAAQTLDTSRAAADFVLASGGAEEAHMVGQQTRVPAAQAAFGNGVLAHSLDYDDTHLPSVLHPSASVIPAALAVAEARSAGAHDVTAAIAAGLEICVRLGMAGYSREARNSLFFEYGQHATSICGAIASAAAAGVLLGLDGEGISHAMGISVSFAGGVLEGNRTGGTVKRAHCGWAAHGGVVAAQLAQGGFTGPPTVLEGKFGFYQAFLRGQFDVDQLVGGLGERWEVPRIFVKPYPANHFTHAGVDAATRMREQGLRPEDVASADLGVAVAPARTIGEPIEVKRRPETGYQAQFSGPYTVAAALFGGSGLGLGLADFDDELVRSPERRALMERITVSADATCNDIFPEQLPAILRVTTRDGRQLEEAVLTTRGGLERPLLDAEIQQKFDDNVRNWIDDASAALIASAMPDPAVLDDISAIMAATAPATTT